MSNIAQPSSGSECPSCKTQMIPDAQFCHACGTSAKGQSLARQRNWKAISVFAAGIVTMSIGMILVVGNYSTKKEEETPNISKLIIDKTSAMPRQPVDLSTMTPREAADRLFNRVMAAEERGDNGEAIQFAPMALQAYQLVDNLDADARYHVGLINVLFGSLDEARKQIESLKQVAPDHLLGLTLSIRLAEKLGDEKETAKARARFAAAYDAEIKAGRAEYEAHRTTIDRYSATAKGS